MLKAVQERGGAGEEAYWDMKLQRPCKGIVKRVPDELILAHGFHACVAMLVRVRAYVRACVLSAALSSSHKARLLTALVPLLWPPVCV